MSNMTWLPGDECVCPLLQQEDIRDEMENQQCDGTCIFWCQFGGDLVGSDEPPEFECMVRLALLKYLGIERRSK